MVLIIKGTEYTEEFTPPPVNKLREKIDEIFDACYSIDGGVCPKHTIFQRQKALNQILALIDKPPAPVLSDEEILDAIKYKDGEVGMSKFNRTAKAQRDSDHKYYTGEG